MLVSTVLLQELQRFADPAASIFVAWPSSRIDARHKWARAYYAYVKDMVDVAPPLTPTTHTLSFTAVESAFFTSITLDNPDVVVAATDFADAWKAAIHALLPDSPATNSGSTFTFAAMDPVDVDTRYATLHADLVASFTTTRGSRRADLDEIAAAFHRATRGIRSTATTFVVTYR